MKTLPIIYFKEAFTNHLINQGFKYGYQLTDLAMGLSLNQAIHLN